MFDLEQHIQSWRMSVSNTLGDHPERIDELEAHLRDDIERLMSSGQTQQDAWDQATLHLGDARGLAGEFAKLDTLARRMWLPAWVAGIGIAVLAAMLAWSVLIRVVSGKAGALLGLHVICVTIGYAAVFAIGFLAFWAVIVHAVGGWTARKDAAFRAAGFRLALLAIVTAAVGVALGMWWSRDHLGRWWGWDPREIGALSVLAWSVLLWQCFRSRASMLPPLKQIALMGNIVVCVSWCGPNLIAGAHLHSYGPSHLAMIVGAFLVTQFLAIYMSLLPAGFLGVERLSFGRKS